MNAYSIFLEFMPPRIQKTLEKEISEIMIVNNRKLAPYIEAVNFSSQNIDQRKLGNILGIFEIKDTSEDSAYIVNFLASVAKKTYFASHHKTALESFEATLYRLNLSLSEVAKHGNINWIGKIDAVLCSMDDKEIHFSVSGGAKVLLLRDDRLTEISSGLSPKDEGVNPIKTFTDIASGRIEDGDKFIITTDDISHIFSIEDLEKHALSFEKNEFLRFLKTALINELDVAGTIIIDVKGKIIETKQIPAKKQEDEEKIIGQSINAFSNKTFEEVAANKQATIEEVTQSDTTENNNEYTHEKTGHIYIKDSEENYEPAPDNNLEKFTLGLKERISNFYFWLKDHYLNKGSYRIKKSLSPSLSGIKEKTGFFLKNTISEKTSSIFSSIKKVSSNNFITIGNFLKKIIPEKSQDIEVEIENNQREIKTNRFKKVKETVSNLLPGKKMVSGLSAPTENAYHRETQNINRRNNLLTPKFKKVIPDFSKISKIFSSMSRKNKLYVLGIIAAIIIVPLVKIKFFDKKEEIVNEIKEEASQDEMAVNPSSDQYVDAEKLYFGENIIGVVSLEEDTFVISKDKITELIDGNMNDYPLPDYAKGATYFSFMEDLNLIFTINDQKKLSSFSPISRKFVENNIDIPENSEVTAIGTYLTYIYLVDSKNNQIYRYPRAEGGFGEKIDWLKEDIPLENITSMSIDENIYLIQNGTPLKLSRGEKEDFNLSKDENSNIEELFTNEELEFIYAIDKQNGEIIKFGKDGSLVSYRSNQEILKANNLWVNKSSGDYLYFSTASEIFKIKKP